MVFHMPEGSPRGHPGENRLAFYIVPELSGDTFDFTIYENAMLCVIQPHGDDHRGAA